MKLRIEGNSLRLRITQTELDTFAKEGRVEERVTLGPDPARRLVYALEASDEVEQLGVTFRDGRITILLPEGWVDAWVATDRVGFEGRCKVGGRELLDLLVEKDFKCLHGDPARRDPDAFPNPAGTD